MDLPTFSSIDPEAWGRSFWEFLDAIVATYPTENCPPEHRHAMRQMLQSLAHLLPCPNCRKHYAEFLSKNSLDTALQSRYSLLRFYFLLKKDVTERTKGSFALRTPDELWIAIVRRLKLVKSGPVPATLLNLPRYNIIRDATNVPKPTINATLNLRPNANANPTLHANGPPVFRVPARVHNNVASIPTITAKSGCGCGKR